MQNAIDGEHVRVDMRRVDEVGVGAERCGVLRREVEQVANGSGFDEE